MKKIAAALICSLMVMFVLVGCTPSNPNTPSNTTIIWDNIFWLCCLVYLGSKDPCC